MHGHGVYWYADGGGVSDLCERYLSSVVYDGLWQDGKMHGQGTYVFPNGNRYEGEWQNDVKSGYGVLSYGT